MTPHPLLGVPVVFRDGSIWGTGRVVEVKGNSIRIANYIGTFFFDRVVADEGTTWRRAGVEYPVAVAEVSPKSKGLGQMLYEAECWRDVPWSDAGHVVRARYSGLAARFVAAYEAGRKTERVTRWALKDTNTGKWRALFGGWSSDKSIRRLFNTRSEAASYAIDEHDRPVKITTRRRVKVSP